MTPVLPQNLEIFFLQFDDGANMFHKNMGMAMITYQLAEPPTIWAMKKGAPGCSLGLEGYTTEVYRDYCINHYKYPGSLLNNLYHGK